MFMNQCVNKVLRSTNFDKRRHTACVQESQVLSLQADVVFPRRVPGHPGRVMRQFRPGDEQVDRPSTGESRPRREPETRARLVYKLQGDNCLARRTHKVKSLQPDLQFA